MRALFRLLSYHLRHKWLLALGFLFSLLGTGFGVLTPQVFRVVIDRALDPAGAGLRSIPWLALAIIGLALARGALQFGRMVAVETAAQRVLRSLRNDLFEHLQKLSFRFFDTARTGDIIARATSDADALRRFLGFASFQLVVSVIQFAAVLAVCIWMDWKLALLALATSPVLSLTAYRFGRRIRPKFEQIRLQIADMTAVLQENLSGLRVVRTYVREQHEIEKFCAEAFALLERNIEAAGLWAFYGPLMNLISSVGTTIILYYGGLKIVAGTLTMGEFVAFMGYYFMLGWPVRILGFAIVMSQAAIAAAQRIFAILDTEPEVQDAPDAIDLDEVRGEVRFENVSFSYTADGPPALSNINLVVRPGECVALLGGTGSGKTTLVNLIPRFYDPDQGRVLIDGIDVRRISQRSLRRHVGFVLQDTFLFSATLRENIAFAKPEATEEEIRQAAERAALTPFIESLEHGLETEIGERGISLSGGQRQRLAIARAILIDPAILILDDCTSSVDAATEQAIQRALQELMRGRTTFIIAQRLSTVRNADRIVVLEDGKIVEQGTHEELVARGGRYVEILRAHRGIVEPAAG